MKIHLDFERGSAINEAFRLQSYVADVELTERMKNIHREIMLKAEKHMPEAQASEVRRLLNSLTAEAARIGCMTGFEYCADIVTEKATQMHRRGDFSDRRSRIDGGSEHERRPFRW